MLENFRLKVFRAVAEQRNFRRAAEQLYLSQPAVTQQIKALEESVGAPLFDRTGREITLTPAGEILLRQAKQSGLILDKALEEIAALRGELIGPLRVAASTTIAQYVLPSILGQFVRLHPAVHAELESANTEAVVTAVLDGSAALGLIEGPAHRRELQMEPWLRDELVLVVPQNHEWAASTISSDQLRGVRLLMRERGSGTRETIERALEKAEIDPKSILCAMELNSTEAILACIEAGLGIGFVSRSAIRRQLALNTLAMVAVDGLDIHRTFTLLTLPGPEPQGSTAALLNHLREYRQQDEAAKSTRQRARKGASRS